jgi:hypothetical protein
MRRSPARSNAQPSHTISMGQPPLELMALIRHLLRIRRRRSFDAYQRHRRLQASADTSCSVLASDHLVAKARQSDDERQVDVG